MRRSHIFPVHSHILEEELPSCPVDGQLEECVGRNDGFDLLHLLAYAELFNNYTILTA